VRVCADAGLVAAVMKRRAKPKGARLEKWKNGPGIWTDQKVPDTFFPPRNARLQRPSSNKTWILSQSGFGLRFDRRSRKQGPCGQPRV